VSIYDKLFGKGAENIHSLIEMATSLHRLGKFDKSEKVYRKVISQGPPCAEAHVRLGILLEDLGRNDEAEKEYRAALKIDPGDVPALNSLGNLYLVSEKFDDAERLYRQGLQIKPDSLTSRSNLGSVLMLKEKYEEAEQELKIALQINPKSAHVHKILGEVYVKTGRYQSSLEEFEKAVELFNEQGRFASARKLEPTVRDLQIAVDLANISQPEPAKGKADDIPWEDSGERDERWRRANKVLTQLFDTHTNTRLQPKERMRQEMKIVNANRPVIFSDSKFFELLDTEIRNTKVHGPAFMTLVYLEIRWGLTGKKEHLDELEEFNRKASKMSFKDLI
jgi:tetratricopeptide (TPR) repeat protein